MADLKKFSQPQQVNKELLASQNAKSRHSVTLMVFGSLFVGLITALIVNLIVELPWWAWLVIATLVGGHVYSQWRNRGY